MMFRSYPWLPHGPTSAQAGRLTGRARPDAAATIAAAVPVSAFPSTTQRMRMEFNSFFKVPGNKYFRVAALIYGLVLCNVGALVLYEKFSHPPVVFDSTFRIGVGCLILGLIGLVVARRSKQQSK
jgi:hypothetical protein